MELLPTRDCEAGYGPVKSEVLPIKIMGVTLE